MLVRRLHLEIQLHVDVDQGHLRGFDYLASTDPSVKMSNVKRVYEVVDTPDVDRHVGRAFYAYIDNNRRVVSIDNHFSYPDF